MKKIQDRKREAGFESLSEIHSEIKDLVEKGVYPDLSQALVALLRAGLWANARLPTDLQAKINRLAAVPRCHPDTLLRQCIEAVFAMIEAERPMTPSIIGEFRSRRRRG